MLFESPFTGVRGNIRTSSIARWKARSQLPIHYNWTSFASSYSSVVISRYWSKSAFFKWGWKGISPTNLCWYQKTRLITLSCDIKISAVFSFVSFQSTRVTDRQTGRQTDGQNYDFQDRASIAASRGKKSCQLSAPVAWGDWKCETYNDRPSKTGTWQCRTWYWRTKSQGEKCKTWQWWTNAATNARPDITLNAEITYRQNVFVYLCCYSGLMRQSIVVTKHYCSADKQIHVEQVSKLIQCHNSVQKFCIERTIQWKHEIIKAVPSNCNFSYCILNFIIYVLVAVCRPQINKYCYYYYYQ